MNFFDRFPSFKGRDFYVAGESYGGIYVPFLAAKIDTENKQATKENFINLKGIIFGNGAMNLTSLNHDEIEYIIFI